MPTTFQTPAEAREAYERWITRTGLADTTRASYTRWVADFTGWLEAAGAPYAEALADPDVRDYAVRDYRRELLTVRNLAPRSVAVAMSAAGSFFTWLGLGRPRGVGVDVGESDRLGVTDETKVRAILRTARRRGPRDYAIVTMLMLAGVRVSELVALNVDDVIVTDRTGQALVRYGKGGKPRKIPLGPQVREALTGWLADRASWPGATESPALFLARGRAGGRLSIRSVQQMVATVGRDAGEPISPHRLRHSFGRRWLESGGDVVSLQRTMGHRSLRTTAGYAKPSDEYLEQQAARLGVDL